MSVVIVSGNERMERQYARLCEEYRCNAKIYTKWDNGIRTMGKPDLLILFTNTVSHKMVKYALNNTKSDTVVARCHSSSMSALKNVLSEHAGTPCA